MFLDSELLDPPPVYTVGPTTSSASTSSGPPGSGSGSGSGGGSLGLSEAQRKNARLPVEALLRVLSLLTHASLDEQTRAEGRVWMMAEGRSVCKAWYLACMSLLRSHYLPTYQAKVIPPYSTHSWSGAPSPPAATTSAVPAYTFEAPLKQRQINDSSIGSPSSSASNWLLTTSNPAATRETKVLDLYIASSARRELDAQESSLFSSDVTDDTDDMAATRDDRALFELWQPRSRLEDLLIQAGLERGVFLRRGQGRQLRGEKGGLQPRGEGDDFVVVAEDISVHFALKEVRVLLPFRAAGGSRAPSLNLVPLARRPVLQMPRERSSTLEASAQLIVQQLSRTPLPIKRFEVEKNGRHQTWYEEIVEEQRAPLTQSSQQQQLPPSVGDGGAGTGAGAGKGKMRDRVGGWFKR